MRGRGSLPLSNPRQNRLPIQACFDRFSPPVISLGMYEKLRRVFELPVLRIDLIEAVLCGGELRFQIREARF